jgi:hypothetical protein
MPRTVAELPSGSRITDYISLGVLAKTFPSGKVRCCAAFWRVCSGWRAPQSAIKVTGRVGISQARKRMGIEKCFAHPPEQVRAG